MIRYDAHSAPFTLHGLCAGEGYARLPEGVRSRLSGALRRLAVQTAGGRVRFTTDAKQIRIEILLDDTNIKTHMTPFNKAGAELYAGAERVLNLRPRAVGVVPYERLDGYALDPVIDYTIERPGKNELYTLYLPTFTGVQSVYISLPGDAAVAEAPAMGDPVVFYGSSITQGACACRPSTTYPARVAAALHCDFVNLGFAGNALGDLPIAEYIAGLPMRAFVLDYDHNAPDAAYLQKTHKPFFEAVRRAQPETRILLITRPDTGRDTARLDECYKVIERTYLDARAAGDTRVALLSGRTFYPESGRDLCLTDFVHPNDEGFAHIAQKVEQALKALL